MDESPPELYPIGSVHASSPLHRASVVCVNFDPEEELVWVGLADVRLSFFHFPNSSITN